MQDIESEHQREIEGLLDNVRELSRELRLQMLIIDQFIPKQYQVIFDIYIRAFFLHSSGSRRATCALE